MSVIALLIGMMTGVVPAKQAFSGSTGDVVVIIASALIVSAAITRSGIIEFALQPVLGRLETLPAQVPAPAGATRRRCS